MFFDGRNIMVSVRDKNPYCLILRKYMTVRNKTKMFSPQPPTFHHLWVSFWILRKTVTTYRNAKKKKKTCGQTTRTYGHFRLKIYFATLRDITACIRNYILVT